MAKTTPRLHLSAALTAEHDILLEREQAHYLTGVLRLNAGDAVRVFNNRDGEWLAYLTTVTKKSVAIRLERRMSDVTPPPDIDFIFAPLKHARLDYMVQKATELGARRLRPVITARTIAERVNLDRMRANATEAAEQCNLVFVPEVLEPLSFAKLMQSWPADRHIIHCDETKTAESAIATLNKIQPPAAVIVGPEGGFTDEERAMLHTQANATSISLGPRILRADTAALAAMALVQAVIGDWRT